MVAMGNTHVYLNIVKIASLTREIKQKVHNYLQFFFCFFFSLLFVVVVQFRTLYLKNHKEFKSETLHTGRVP